MTCWPRNQGAVGNRIDGGQRLAPKTHGADGFKIHQIRDFAGGVAFEGNRQLFRRNADAVVFHRNQPYPTGGQAHGDLRCTRVQRVVHQLAHDGGGAFDDFARGDLADQLVRQFADGAAWGGCRGV